MWMYYKTLHNRYTDYLAFFIASNTCSKTQPTLGTFWQGFHWAESHNQKGNEETRLEKLRIKQGFLALTPGQFTSLGSLLCLSVCKQRLLELEGLCGGLWGWSWDEEFLSLQSPVLTHKVTRTPSRTQINGISHESNPAHVLECLEDTEMLRWGSRCRIQHKKQRIQQGIFLHLVNSQFLFFFFFSPIILWGHY